MAGRKLHSAFAWRRLLQVDCKESVRSERCDVDGSVKALSRMGEVCGAGCAGWNMEAVQTEGATDACRALVS